MSMFISSVVLAAVAVVNNAALNPAARQAKAKNYRTPVVTIDATVEKSPLKPMNAVNNGPILPYTPDRSELVPINGGNLEEFRAARIPFVRTHDAAFNASYGGEHTVDITAIFPDFAKDENDPASYDFACTDQYLKEIRASGAEVFFRLGQKIDHRVRKYDSIIPSDFGKWARICEHVISHYNEGWANGFKWNIRYWEIWNEADLDTDDCTDSRCWMGTEAQYFDFYETAAKHLKARFPNVLIGGPALAFREDWGRRFLKMCADRKAPLDFFSWHCYFSNVKTVVDKARRIRAYLDEAGFKDTPSILNEWNGGPSDGSSASLFRISPACAALVASTLCALQDEPVDMLMYYDARPDTTYNGLFEYGTLNPDSSYFALYGWGRLQTLGTHVSATVEGDPTVYAVAAKGRDGHKGVLISRYRTDCNARKTAWMTVRSSSGPLLHATAHFTDAKRLNSELPVTHNADGSISFKIESEAFVYVDFD